MWKIALLIFVLVSTASSQNQNITIECDYYINVFDEYVCELRNITVTDSSANVTITGSHVGNRTDVDVEVVEIWNSNTPFMIREIFEAFGHLNELTIVSSNLQSINLTNTAWLNYLYFEGNNITTIHNGSFANAPNLFVVDLSGNNIQFVEENAFEGLSDVINLYLMFNRIREIPSAAFRPLRDLRYLDLESNLLDRINNATFEFNHDLTVLYMEYNNIDSVHPDFTKSLPSLGTFNLRGNICVSNLFSTATSADLQSLNNALQNCFHNFEGLARDTNRVQMDFAGNFTISDRFGNVVFTFM